MCCVFEGHAASLATVQDALAANVTQEQGKTLADAKGDVFRGLGMPAIQTACFFCISPIVAALNA